jgi:hypothetical protein
MSSSVELQNKIINLIKSILIHYQSLEIDSTIKYYAHNECDSNVTEFEGMSNSRRIVLATSLNINFVHVIMRIFQCVYDSNYWVFENIEENSDPSYLANSSLKYLYIDKNYLLELLTFSNPIPWINYLEKVYKDGDNEMYESVPSVESKYYQTLKQQKIYTIADIIKLTEK